MESGWRLPALRSVGDNTSPGLRAAGPSETRARTRASARELVCLCTHLVPVHTCVMCVHTRAVHVCTCVVCAHTCGACVHVCVHVCCVHACVVCIHMCGACYPFIIQDLHVSVHAHTCSCPFSMFSACFVCLLRES